jgi:hypothetical protein
MICAYQRAGSITTAKPRGTSRGSLFSNKRFPDFEKIQVIVDINQSNQDNLNSQNNSPISL